MLSGAQLPTTSHDTGQCPKCHRHQVCQDPEPLTARPASAAYSIPPIDPPPPEPWAMGRRTALVRFSWGAEHSQEEAAFPSVRRFLGHGLVVGGGGGGVMRTA